MSERNLAIDQMRIIAAFAVVVLHVAAQILYSTPLFEQTWWAAHIIDTHTRWSVPFFVMITGTLLIPSLRDEKLSLTDYYRKRSKLVALYLFWIFAYLTYSYLAKTYIKGEAVAIDDITQALLSGKPHYHLWYFTMIIPLVFMLPFAIRLFDSRTKLLVAGMVLLFANGLYHAFFQTDDGVTALPPYLWWAEFMGYAFIGYAIFHSTFSVLQKGLCAVLYFSFASLVIYLMYHMSLEQQTLRIFWYDYVGFPVIIMSLTLFTLLKSTKHILPTQFIMSSAPLMLGIYLIHPVLIDILTYIIQPNYSFFPAIQILLWSSLIFALSLLLCKLIAFFSQLRWLVAG